MFDSEVAVDISCRRLGIRSFRQNRKQEKVSNEPHNLNRQSLKDRV